MNARRQRQRSLLTLLATIMVAGSGAQAQDVAQLVLPTQLPRAGYEPQSFRFGLATLATQLDLATQYDTNVFATSRDASDDVIVQISPRIQLDADPGRWRLHGEAFAVVREYFDNSSESNASFGVAGSARFLADRQHNIDGGFRAERIIESRNDPEAAERRDLSPRAIDAYQGSLGLALRRGSLGFGLRAEVQRLDYRPREDADRSLVSLRSAARLTYAASAGLTAFAEAYVNRRDNDESEDRNGINRDATTLGATAGIKLSLTGRLSGEIGVGGFRADPDDPTLDSFSGVAANGNLIWSPTPRMAIIANLFNGDVATVRSGASGRVDTRLGLRVSLEARHNLLIDLDASHRTTQFRGTGNTQRTVGAGVRGELLVSRLLGVFVEAEYTRRRADIRTENFNRTFVALGIRLRH